MVREFYNTFSFDLSKNYNLSTKDVLKFKVLGIMHRFSIDDFNESLGFVIEDEFNDPNFLDSFCDYLEEFNPLETYRLFTGDSEIAYDPGKSKANLIQSAPLRYIHRFLAYSFSSRKDNPIIISMVELFFLWCMVNMRKTNLGHWLITQFYRVKIHKRAIILGPIITALAKFNGLIDIDNTDLRLVREMTPVDLHSLDSIGLLCSNQISYFSFAPAGPLLPVQRRVFRTLPRVRPRAEPITNEAPDNLEERI